MTNNNLNFKKMKKSIYIVVALISVILCVKNANAQIEDPVVGSYLNVGSSNVIGDGVDYGNAIGLQNEIHSNCSLAAGSFNTIYRLSPCSAIFGNHNIISAMDGFIVGSSNITASGLAMAFGSNLTVAGLNSISFGSGYYNGVESIQFENTINCSFTVGFNSTKPTFLVYGPRNVGDVIDMTGKIAIGDVSGDELRDTDAKMIIRSDEGEKAGIILEPKQPETNSTFIRLHDENHGISVGTNGEMCINSGAENNQLPLTLNGKVGINAANDIEGFSLTVGGGIITDEVLIKDVSAWHDYVFGKNYGLMPLNELKAYISENQHLPDVPSEKEVMENGIELSEMQGILLKKIEELTLYTLKQQEIIESLQSRIEELERK